MGHIIRLENVSHWYPREDGGRTRVLSRVNLRVSEGDFVTVVGPTGCGKSTTLKFVLGSEAPVEGDAFFNGGKITHPDRNRGIVFQQYPLFENMTVQDNIALGLELESFVLLDWVLRTPRFRRGKKKFRAEAKELIIEVGLDPGDAEKYPHQLSGGMRQRVAIAQAMKMKPKVFLFDEPFRSVDERTQSALQLLVLKMWRETKCTVFFVTHNLKEALFLGTRIVVLSQYYAVPAGEENQGSMVVVDNKLPEFKEYADVFKPEFALLEGKIWKQGLDPANLQTMDAFDITHPDGWHPTKGWVSGR